MSLSAHGLLLVLAAQHVVEVHDRTPLALALATPTGEAAKINNSEIIRVVTDLFEQHTDFQVELLDERAVERCRGRLYCLAEEEAASHSRFMLVLTMVAIEGQADRASALLLDADLARALAQDETSTDRIEATVSEQAVLASPPRRELPDADAAARFLEQLVTVELRPAFEKAGRWEPWGTIAIGVGAEEPLEISIDGRTVGTTEKGANELIKVSPGEHQIRLKHPSYDDAELTVQLERGARADLGDAPLVRTAGGATVLRPITLWSGLVVVLSGAVIGILGVVRHDGEVNTACFAGTECSHDGFTTFGYAPKSAEAKNVNPSGVLMAPLGWSLAAAGATWSLGTLLFGGPDDVPWIQWLAGLALGAAAYGITVAVGG